MSQKPVLAIDIDEVLADFMPSLVKFHNDTYNTSLTPKDFHSYQFHDVWGGNLDDCIVKMNAFFASDYFANITPIVGAFDMMVQLKSHFDLHIVTSRSFNVASKTEQWLDTYFPNIFSQRHFGNHYGETGLIRSKPQMCSDISAFLLVDDSSLYAFQCAQVGLHVVLFGDYSWNAVEIPPDFVAAGLVTRASDWTQAYKAILQVAVMKEIMCKDVIPLI
jgi:5'(3')-deoxyribonucleotidase